MKKLLGTRLEIELDWVLGKNIVLLYCLMLIGCTKNIHRNLDPGKVNLIEIRGRDLRIDEFAPPLAIHCDTSCWNNRSWQFYVFIKEQNDIDTIVQALSDAKRINFQDDYDSYYDYIICLNSDKGKKLIYVNSGGVIYNGDGSLYESSSIHELIIISLGDNVYNEEMGVPHSWIFSEVKKKHSGFSKVIPERLINR